MLSYPMAHGQEQGIYIDAAPIIQSAQTHSEVGIYAPTVAIVDAGGHKFSIVDVRQIAEFATSYLVADKSYKDYDRGHGYKGLWPNNPITIGRSNHADRFDYLPGVSREHFSVAYNGLALIVSNHTPTNPTLLSGDFNSTLSRNVTGNIIAEYTDLARDDVQPRYDFGPQDHEASYGYYKNHPIIGRKSASVKNGVYFTTSPDSEAVVVDDKSKTLQLLRHNLVSMFNARYGSLPTLNVTSALKQVNNFTRDVMPYSVRNSDRLSKPLYAGNKLIGLSEFVQAKGGVCRHQCLLAAFLAESLVEEGLILGQVGVERNHDIDAHGAHAWAIFKTLDGQCIVIDPAQNYVGTKEQARSERRWKYDLPFEA
jgi:hypothetical protein